MPVPPGAPSMVKQVDLRVTRPANRHGQLAHRVGPGLEGDAPRTHAADAFDLLHEPLTVDEPQPGVALELLQRPGLERRLVGGKLRIGGHDVAALFQLERPSERVDLDFAADAFGPLAPFQLDGLHSEFFDDVFGDPQAGVLYVHLHQDVAVAFVVAAILLHAAVHFGGFDHLALRVQLEPGVDAAHVFSADDGDTADGGADREMLPVLAGDVGAAQGTGEDRDLHFHLGCGPISGLGVDIREGCLVGVRLDPLGPQGIAHDVQMGIIHRVVLVGPGGDITERLRVEHFAAPEGRAKQVAVAAAPVDAAAADSRLGRHVPGTVGGLKRVIGIRPV